MKIPFEVVRVPGAQALDEYNALVGQGRGYPLLVGSEEDLRNLSDTYGLSRQSPEEMMLLSRQLDPLAWLKERAAGDPEYYEEIHAEWPAQFEPRDHFIAHTNILTRKPLDEACILLLPVEDSWQVPCVLNYGGWNECPPAEVHASLFRHWEKKYDAGVVTLSPDTIEMWVDRPPGTREEAMALAHEQYLFCADIVQQGTDSIEALAATLLNANVWYFWWD